MELFENFDKILEKLLLTLKLIFVTRKNIYVLKNSEILKNRKVLVREIYFKKKQKYLKEWRHFLCIFKKEDSQKGLFKIVFYKRNLPIKNKFLKTNSYK